MKYFFLLIIILCGCRAFSQRSINGQIKDDKGKAIPDANIILYSVKGNEVLTYAISDSKGMFLLTFDNSLDSLRLEITCIGYSKTIRHVANRKEQQLDFKLSTAVNELPEIIVRQEPIKVSGDTINYDAKSFSDKSDRVLLDVLKKMPGINVTATGQILFNNKPINKFYIEGKDLLESKYNIATNNLPSDAVDQIQVLQNHQPIALLNGIETSDRAAINIKLNKKAKFKLLGSGQVGIGLKPFLSDNKLSLLKFNKSYQFIGAAKHNNIGINLDDELREQNNSQYTAENIAVKEKVSLIKPNEPLVDQSRYRFNNNSLATGNLLFGLSKSYDVKINTAFERDKLKETANSLTTIYFPDRNIVINEQTTAFDRFYKLLTGVVLEGNSQKIFLKNTLKFQKDWQQGSSYISTLNLNQQLNSPASSLVNELNGILNVRKTLLGVNSVISYADQPQLLNVTPGQFQDLLNGGNPYSAMRQQIQTKGFFTDNSTSFTKKFGSFSLNEKIGLLGQSQRVENNLYLDDNGNIITLGTAYNNSTLRTRFNIYNESSLSFEDTRFKVSMKLNAGWNKLSSKNNTRTESNDKIIANPSINALYRINAYWQTTVGASIGNRLAYEANPSFLLRNYRTLISNDVPLVNIKNRSLSYSLGYKNVISALYSNLDIRYSKNISNILLSTMFDGILQTQTAIIRENPYSNATVSWNINKYYLEAKTVIDLSATYDNSKMQQLQENELATLRSNTYIVALKVNSKLQKNAAIDYQAQLITDRNSSQVLEDVTRYSPNTFIKQHLGAKYFLPADFQLYLSIDNFYNKQNTTRKLGYSFADFKVQKSIVRPKLDFSVFISNIFDVKSYNDFSYSLNNFISSSYLLRGRTYMFNIGFQF